MSDSSSPRPPEQQVATRVAQNYLTLGWDAEVLSNERNVFVYLPKQRRIELVLDDPPEEEQVRQAASFLAEGLEVWVIVPQCRLADVYSQLRGNATMLQGYWVADDGLRFDFPRRL